MINISGIRFIKIGKENNRKVLIVDIEQGLNFQFLPGVMPGSFFVPHKNAT